MRRPAVLLLAVVLAACSGDSGSGGSGEVGVRVTFDEPLRVGPVVWTVVVTNDTSDDLELTFPTGQRAHVTLSQGGEVVYQWSRAQLFTQMIDHVRIPAGGKRQFTLDEPGLDVDPGRYTMTAVVSASNRPDLRHTRTVTVEPG